jgi:hypothetical protein
MTAAIARLDEGPDANPGGAVAPAGPIPVGIAR